MFIGTPSECDGNSPNYCCSKFGFCGPGPDHCDCVGCIGIALFLQFYGAMHSILSSKNVKWIFLLDFRSKTPIGNEHIWSNLSIDHILKKYMFSVFM